MFKLLYHCNCIDSRWSSSDMIGCVLLIGVGATGAKLIMFVSIVC